MAWETGAGGGSRGAMGGMTGAGQSRGDRATVMVGGITDVAVSRGRVPASESGTFLVVTVSSKSGVCLSL